MVRVAIGAASVGLMAICAHADARFASLHLDSIACDVPESVNVSREGTSSLGFSGSVGPVSGGAPATFSLTLDLSFDSFSVPGDGFVSFLSFHPSFASGALQVTDFSVSTELFAGATLVSHLDGIGGTPAPLAPDSSTTIANFASFFDAPGAPGFGFIGDNGTLTAQVNFSWTGSSPGDALTLEVLPDSEITYAFFIPSPAPASVAVLSVVPLVRRRR